MSPIIYWKHDNPEYAPNFFFLTQFLMSLVRQSWLQCCCRYGWGSDELLLWRAFALNADPAATPALSITASSMKEVRGPGELLALENSRRPESPSPPPRGYLPMALSERQWKKSLCSPDSGFCPGNEGLLLVQLPTPQPFGHCALSPRQHTTQTHSSSHLCSS